MIPRREPLLFGDAAQQLSELLALGGGPGAVVCLGLLLAGVAVTSGLHRLLPGWMMAAGLGLAAAAELSASSLVWPALGFLLPVARLLGMAWLVGAGALLPVTRGREEAGS